MPELTPLIITVPIASTIAGYAALRAIQLLSGQIGGKESKKYKDAQGVLQKTLGQGVSFSNVVGSNKRRGCKEDDE